MTKKILFVDWFFISHRLEALKKGYEVHLACGISDKKEYLGIKVHPLNLSRSGTGELKAFIQCIKKSNSRYSPFCNQYFMEE